MAADAFEAAQREWQAKYDALNRRYAQDIADLERREREQMDALRARLARMTEQQRQEQEKEIRESMARVRQSAAARLRELEADLERRLAELQEYYESKLAELAARIADKESREQAYAESQRQAAELALEAARQDEAVLVFMPDAVRRITDRMNSAESLYRQGLFTAAAVLWFRAAAESRAAEAEAEIRRHRWQRRTGFVRARLETLEAEMEKSLTGTGTFRHVLAESDEKPAEWLEGLPRMERLRDAMRTAREVFDTAAPGDMDAMDRVELGTFGLEEEIAVLAREAALRIRCFLCCVELLHLLYLSAGEDDWSVTDGGAVERFANEGDMRLTNGLNDALTVHVFVQENSYESFGMTIAYSGTRANQVLLQRLGQILTEFRANIGGAESCGMDIVSVSHFLMGGYPGVTLEMRLIDRSAARPPVREEPAARGDDIGEHNGKKTEEGQKHEF